MNSYILVGAPNSGKTTIFNALTSLREKVGNWHGVTATYKKGVYISKNATFEVVDLPGIYSLDVYSCEERVTADYILTQQYDAIILVVDATSPFSAYKLLDSLLPLGKKIILLLNKSNKAHLDNLAKENFFIVNPYNKKSVNSFATNLKNCLPCKKLFDLKWFKQPQKPFYDKILLKWYVFLPIFFIFIALGFLLAFSPFLGGFLSKILQRGIEKIAVGLSGLVSGRFLSAIILKTLNGLAGVVSLIPQVVVLQFCLYLLEESGFTCRFCVIAYRFLSKLGLSGKSLFPLISSLGCGAVSCKMCNACENNKIKEKTLKLIPFFPCSAKNSVAIFICLKTFSNPYVALLIAYFMLFIIATIYALVTAKKQGREQESMFIDLVDITFPNIKRISVEVISVACEFFKKIASVCMVISFFLAIFTSVTPSFSYTENLQNSIICFACKKLAFLLNPLALGDWKILLSLALGIFAKEGVISSLCALYPQGVSFAFNEGVVLLAFTLIYPPCLTNLAALEKERKFLAIKIFVKHTVFAYFIALYLRIMLTKFYIFCIITLIIIGVYILYERVYCAKRRKLNANFVKRRVKLFHNKKTL